MIRIDIARRAALGVVAAATLTALAACADNGPATVITGPAPANALFTSYVALGNSITAGMQSGGIVDSTQQQSYAALLAAQMHTPYAYPSLAAPGCPPPIVNFQTQARLGGGTSTTCALRNPASIAPALNNVAVPGATSLDPTSTSTAASTALTTFILGGKTQVQKAADVNPTFFTAWIGNNDVLPAAVSGVVVPTAGVSPGITSQTTFQSNYNAMVAGLKAIPTIKGGVLIGVVQVSLAPVLFPAAALFNPQFKAGFDQFVGQTTTILPTCTPTTTALISFQIVSAIRSGQHPPVIGCAKNSIPGTPVGDIFVLDSAEQVTVQTAVANYNAYIQSVATANGWGFYDPNTSLLALRANGCVLPVVNLASATQPFGPCISLDGIHPAAPAHKRIVNDLIAVINAKYGTSLSPVSGAP
jgi:lysophospholipase L1-like esterase